MKLYRGKLGNSETYLLIVECPFCFYQISEKYCQFFILTSLNIYNTWTLLIPVCYVFSVPLHSIWTPCNSTRCQECESIWCWGHLQCVDISGTAFHVFSLVSVIDIFHLLQVCLRSCFCIHSLIKPKAISVLLGGIASIYSA